METPPVYGWNLPPDISSHGASIDHLINVLHVFMLVLFVGWFAFMVYTLWRFRARPGHTATYKTEHFQIPAYAEVGVALFEVVLLVFFSFPIVKHLKMNFPRPDPGKTLQVRVVAEQFAWNIHYPGPDGVFGHTDARFVDPTTNPLGRDPADPGGRDDVVTLNQLAVPVDKPVTVFLSSKDVIHSFNIPVLRIKQDAIPGESIPLWFEAKQTSFPGGPDFEIACAQLCGNGHYRMRGTLLVQSAADFDQWLATKGKEMAPLGKKKAQDDDKEEEFE